MFMSKLLKSRFILEVVFGVMAVSFLSAFALATVSAEEMMTAEAPCTITKTLKFGSKGYEVKCLQKNLGVKTTGYFGKLTKAAVVAFQTSKGLKADGVFGAKSRAAWSASAMMVAAPVVPAVAPAPVAAATGPVAVALATDTPAAGSSIVNSQATASVASFTFTGKGTVSSVTLKRTGFSDSTTLTNVYLYDGMTRLTDGYSFSSTTSELTMNNLGIMIDGSKNIMVKADVLSTATNTSSTIAVSLVGFTSGTDKNTVNLSGNVVAVVSAPIATITFSGVNTVSAKPVDAGTTTTLWGAPIQVNTRDLWLKGINFRITGSAPSDALSSIKLYVNGEEKAMDKVVTIMGTTYSMFDLSAAPIKLTTGAHNLEVRAKIEKGSNRDVTFAVQQAADVVVFDPQVGVNIAIGTSGAGVLPNTAGKVTINTGSVSVEKDSTFNTLTNIVGGSSNVPIAKFKVRAYGEDVKVSSIIVTPSFPTNPANPAPAGLDNISLYFNGSQIGTQQDWTSGNLTFQLGSQMIVSAGVDSILEVRSDIRTNASVNYISGSIKADLAVGASNAQGQSSLTSINVPTGVINGTTLTIQTANLAISKNPNYSTQNVNPNDSGVKIGSFVLQNQSSVESVRITTLNVALTFGDGTSATNYTALKTSETSGSGATPIQPAASNSFSVDFTLAPGATKTIDILANTGSATGNTVKVTATLTVTSIGSTSNISTTSSVIPGQTLTSTTGTVDNPTVVTASTTSAQFIAAGGTAGAADASKLTLNFVSTNGASVINKLKFTATDSDANNDAISFVKVGGVSAPVVGGTAYLTGLSLQVPNGGSLSKEVLVSYSKVGTGATTPGTTASVALSEFEYTSGGTTITTTGLTIPATAINMTLVGSKPTVIVPSVTGSGFSLTSDMKIGEVTVVADSKGNIKLDRIIFTSSVSGYSNAPIAITDARITLGTDSNAITGSLCTPTGLFVTCNLGTASTTDYDGLEITAGTSQMLSLYGTASGANTGTGKAQVSTKIVAQATDFIWDDTSTVGGAGSKALTASNIVNFPNSSYTVSQ
jgi:hypothetical protein